MFRLTHPKIKSSGFDENLKFISPEILYALNFNIDSLNICLSYIGFLPDAGQYKDLLGVEFDRQELIDEMDARLPNINFSIEHWAPKEYKRGSLRTSLYFLFICFYYVTPFD